MKILLLATKIFLFWASTQYLAKEQQKYQGMVAFRRFFYV